jgi:hypothetical protein
VQQQETENGNFLFYTVGFHFFKLLPSSPNPFTPPQLTHNPAPPPPPPHHEQQEPTLLEEFHFWQQGGRPARGRDLK